ncbi:aminotransferase class I/II-fold pyridoxal phosphate-dependent enzyme [Polaribacter sp. Z022]|uniref:DegT/DnrJ/EryC1/StrS family aminotransferase n=1 Tax=Polaribacter sp. Z022 TaxID=2927125 RepID=UPI002020BE3B|nr:aminotransferase class I/II-fold pyridoxal phosphate-dependent enzyme [Polaribacter sp. Z022]MCL7754801.1 DegT/DnrJ/EryC1/StrS family aminotransferase [Polaribacter sp. Z022]
MQAKIPLSDSTIHLDLKTEISSISKDSIHAFEEVLENYFQADKKIVALNSGTSAIHLALILSGITKGDEVLCQSFTYVATVNPVIYQNATPIFIDSEKETWNMCPIHLEEAIKDRILKGKKPKAIIVVHLYGMPAQMDQIVKISKKYKITLIEDAAEALGSEYKGKKCGTFGDFGIISFNNNKIISTLGGGALICNTEKEKNKAIFYASQSKEKALHYEHKELGYNYRMNTVAAIIGLEQMLLLNENKKRRRAINNYYNHFFKKYNDINVLTEKSNDYSSNHWLSCIKIIGKSAKEKKEKIMLCLENNNIETRSLWKPMHLQPVFKGTPYYGNDISENLFNFGLCLPSGSNLKNDVLKIITSSIHKLL